MDTQNPPFEVEVRFPDRVGESHEFTDRFSVVCYLEGLTPIIVSKEWVGSHQPEITTFEGAVRVARILGGYVRPGLQFSINRYNHDGDSGLVAYCHRGGAA